MPELEIIAKTPELIKQNKEPLLICCAALAYSASLSVPLASHYFQKAKNKVRSFVYGVNEYVDETDYRLMEIAITNMLE